MTHFVQNISTNNKHINDTTLLRKIIQCYVRIDVGNCTFVKDLLTAANQYITEERNDCFHSAVISFLSTSVRLNTK